MNLTEKQIEDHKAWLQDQKPAHQAYVGVLIADKLTAALRFGGRETEGGGNG